MSFAPALPTGVASLDDERRRRLLAALEGKPKIVDRLLADLVAT